MNFCPKCGNKTIFKVVDNSTRAVCNNCNVTHWNNPIPVVAALVKHEGKYILARNKEWDKGVFSLIAGYLESGEEIENAVLREVKEELNLDGKIINSLGYYSLLEKNQIILAFEIETIGTMKMNYELVETIQLSDSELSSYDFSYFELTEKIINTWVNLHENRH